MGFGKDLAFCACVLLISIIKDDQKGWGRKLLLVDLFTKPDYQSPEKRWLQLTRSQFGLGFLTFCRASNQLNGQNSKVNLTLI